MSPNPASTHVERLKLHEFGAFSNATFEFVDGINVFIGTNATGKSHAMKALYSALKTIEGPEGPLPFESRLLAKLANVFQPHGHDVSRLVRRRHGANRADVVVESQGGVVDFSIVPKAKIKLRVNRTEWQSSATSIFLPSHEALSIYRGFAAAYQSRELTFDETYYDICVALGAARLKGSRMAEASRLLEPIEAALGGKVVAEDDDFYLRLKDGAMEVTLVSEGFRKLAMIAQLVANGSLQTNGFLFWDEPEANLNPQLVTLVANLLLELARQGLQIFVTTHDYLLVSRLSAIAEYEKRPDVPMRFFSFHRPSAGAAVEVTGGATMADLPENPILDEFSRHYDFERDLFAEAARGHSK